MRTVVGWITHHPDTVTEEETTQLKAILDSCPEQDQTHQLVRAFAEMLARRTGAPTCRTGSAPPAPYGCRG
ncbi:hypothetical protein [Streptomyces albicerus]|uniref:hypothetical protein n=1 Tax=Streptomyces albicerus TaxID=2569859 RepID=UPI00124B76B3|nr:hypothetical protein [Streptomyces albicerus]